MQAAFCFLLLSSLSTALPQRRQAQTPYTPYTTVLNLDFQKNWYQDCNTTNSVPVNGQYICPSSVDQYPKMQTWLSWSKMWEVNAPDILSVNKGSQDNVNFLKAAIEEHSAQSKVDARIILGIVLIESKGQVDIGASQTNPNDIGLMQMRGGRDFDSSNPKESISNMILDGLYGNTKIFPNEAPNGTPGFLTEFNGDQMTWIQKTSANWRDSPFGTARVYNSGDAPDPDLRVCAQGTNPKYACELASRLQGWRGD